MSDVVVDVVKKFSELRVGLCIDEFSHRLFNAGYPEERLGAKR